MNIAYIGDFKKLNGPSVVDVQLTEHVSNASIERIESDKSTFNGFLSAIKECDIVVVSGVSLKGTLGFLLGLLLNKKRHYIMHGALQIEKDFRKIRLHRFFLERLLIGSANYITCVSRPLKEMVERKYTDSINKISFINNGIDTEIHSCLIRDVPKIESTILTVGGGRPEKGILFICQAISELKNLDIKLIVAGEDGIDSTAIQSFPFVEYKGFIPRSELLRLMAKTPLFIQNSAYEPFGMAPVEAFLCNCRVIISHQVGAGCFLDDPLVYKCAYDDVKQLALTIQKALCNNNSKHVFDSSTLGAISWSRAAKEYEDAWERLMDSGK
jgi:glycosyltransferase involved in cell wall biosynthesis